MTTRQIDRALYAVFVALVFGFCVLCSLGCAPTRYTMEQYWPASGEEPGVVVIQWPEGIEPGDVITSEAMDPVTETTRTLSGAAWTKPPEP